MVEANWDSFARINAGERFRAQSAAMGASVTRAIVEEARIVPGLRVLDVACGSGEPAISIAMLLRESGQVIGADVSPAPLQVAAERTQKHGLSNVQFVQADVHRLPFEDMTFDRVVSRLGVMFFADLPRALREIYRVLKPAGRASLLAWGTMQQPYFHTTIGTVLSVLPEGRVPAPAAAMFKFSEPGTLAHALEDAGFNPVEETTRKVAWNWAGSPEELWEYFQDVTVPFKALLQSIPSHREDVHRQVLEALRQRFDGKEVKFDAEVVLASGQR